MKIGEYRTHPAADEFPLIEGEEFERLVESIREHGLEDPIVLVIEKGVTLILDGRNRYRGCIAAKVKPRFETYRGKDPWGYVWAKNGARRDLTPSQKGLIAAKFAQRRQGRVDQTGKFAGLPTQDEAGKKIGVSERMVRYGKTVLDKTVPAVQAAVAEGRMAIDAGAEFAKLPREQQRVFADRLKDKKNIRTGHVRALVRQEVKRSVIAKINAAEVAPLPLGPFRLILADWPWPYENSDQHAGSRGHMPYPPMSIDDICAMITKLDPAVHPEGCILAGWTTNAFIFEMPRILGAWRFTPHTVQTLVKSKIGMGHWSRGRTEHLVIASRGTPTHTLNEVSTWICDRVIEMPPEHSQKPLEVYEMLERHCPGPRLELFAREPRAGWARWGAEVDKFEERAA